MAVNAFFNPGAGVLSVLGDSLANSLALSRDATGKILVNSGAVVVKGGVPSVANTFKIQAFGTAGNDTISFNEANGALPAGNLFGGTGNDNMTGGSGGDQLFGQAGDDTLLGKGGFDFLFGGDGNDTLTGGDADDQVFGQGGNDRFIWNPGDDTDLFEGGAGIDTVEVNGGGGAEQFTVTANGTRVRFDRLDPAPFAIDIGTSENLVLNAGGGDDIFSATGNLAALIKLDIDGGAGNDTINGGNGIDLLKGGDGNDVVDGNQGNDTAFLGAGDDRFQWDPGDGSDIVEGQDGLDTMDFNGSAANEIMTLSANGGRALLTRDVGNIVMDMDGIEKILLDTLGGTDTVNVGDLTGTDINTVVIDLGATAGGGDGLADTVVLNATAGDDIIGVENVGGVLKVFGLSSVVEIHDFDIGIDKLVINTLGGDDVVDASTLDASIVFQADGGDGDDVLLGGAGVDTLLGGLGDDVLIGGAGLDILDGGVGSNVIFQ